MRKFSNRVPWQDSTLPSHPQMAGFYEILWNKLTVQRHLFVRAINKCKAEPQIIRIKCHPKLASLCVPRSTNDTLGIHSLSVPLAATAHPSIARVSPHGGHRGLSKHTHLWGRNHILHTAWHSAFGAASLREEPRDPYHSCEPLSIAGAPCLHALPHSIAEILCHASSADKMSPSSLCPAAGWNHPIISFTKANHALLLCVWLGSVRTWWCNADAQTCFGYFNRL